MHPYPLDQHPEPPSSPPEPTPAQQRRWNERQAAEQELLELKSKAALLEEIQKVSITDSITKWGWKLRQAQNGICPSIGSKECPCCAIFYIHQCRGCPVQEYTGHRYCRSTPYERVQNAINYDTDDLVPAVTAELEFLKEVALEICGVRHES